ncbi:MAG: hypothetical protein PUG60_03580 [Lachnospiraceae bacterium]|nr:hypothetical protein [Lachnospiraceae bacterium]MDY4971254.1 hypothetical protein [Lachnospiraceae bacterium]
MAIYDVLVESINPCGGDRHSEKKFIEVETDDPVAYVKENGQWDIIDVTENKDGDQVITTGDGNGYITKYIFSE